MCELDTSIRANIPEQKLPKEYAPYVIGICHSLLRALKKYIYKNTL